jgi:Na+/H+ antiporter NhaC
MRLYNNINIPNILIMVGIVINDKKRIKNHITKLIQTIYRLFINMKVSRNNIETHSMRL